MAYVVLRPSLSEAEDQKKRPPMLKSESSPTKPAAAAGATPRVGWRMGEAVWRTPMPALTLRKSTNQTSQNCGVLMASAALTSAVVMSFCAVALGVQPAGFHPGCGTRTVKTPNIMNEK